MNVLRMNFLAVVLALALTWESLRSVNTSRKAKPMSMPMPNDSFFQVGREAYCSNQIGGAAWLAAPRSYRSTSAFEAIRANLAVPLRMALKMRSKLGCQASNLLCSAVPNNAIIEGMWIFEVGDCVRPDACAPTVACRFIFFGRQKNSIPSRRA